MGLCQISVKLSTMPGGGEKRRRAGAGLSAAGRMSGVTSVRRTPLHPVTVTAVATLTPRMRRITLAADSLVGRVSAPAQDIEEVLPDGAGRRLKRHYTIRRVRPDLGELDIDALLHPHGPG